LVHLKIAMTSVIQEKIVDGSVMIFWCRAAFCSKTVPPWMRAVHLVSAAVQNVKEKQVSFDNKVIGTKEKMVQF
jgi:hypothetical protein